MFFLVHPGGCLLALKEAEEAAVSEEGQSADNLAATVISEDPPTVLVEFSSVVADTQEYIIEVVNHDGKGGGWGVPGCSFSAAWKWGGLCFI